jgi:hypothetical protein
MCVINVIRVENSSIFKVKRANNKSILQMIPAQFDAKTIEINGMPTGWKIITFSEPDHRTPYIVIPPNVGLAWGIC